MVDQKYPQREFQCPLGMHILSQNPVIATCCGQTACLKCAIFEIVGDNTKDDNDLKCCFCQEPIDIMQAENEAEESNKPVLKARLLPNMRLRKLMAVQLRQYASTLSKADAHYATQQDEIKNDK